MDRIELWEPSQNLGFWIILPNFPYCDTIKNSLILFSEILLVSCTKKLGPIFFRFFSKNLRVQNCQIFPKKNLDSRLLLIKPWSYAMKRLKLNSKIWVAKLDQQKNLIRQFFCAKFVWLEASIAIMSYNQFRLLKIRWWIY